MEDKSSFHFILVTGVRASFGEKGKHVERAVFFCCGEIAPPSE